METDLRRAVTASHLAQLRHDRLDALLVGARQEVVRLGRVLYWEGEQTTHLLLVVGGVLRVRVAAPDGRTMTVRYCRTGSLLGAMSFFRQRFAMPATIEALTETKLLRIDPSVVRRSLAVPEVAHVLLDELAERAEGFLLEIAGAAFGTVRQRVARHLLDLADERSGPGPGRPEFVAEVSQQELADATGTVREVVVRVLRELRVEGLVRTGRGEIVVLDASRLLDESDWNTGS